MPKMKSNFRGLVTLLAKNLYPEPDVFVRELIQNAHDGIALRRVSEPSLSGRIQLTADAASRTLEFTDNGLGMDRHVIEEFLSTIGASGTGTMTQELRSAGAFDPATIGQFGIGLLSAFVVAERIDIFTRRLDSEEAWHWSNMGDDEYQLEPTTEMPQPGTQVTLTVRRDFAEFLDETRLAAAIRKYADFVPYPILLNERGPINAIRPPWEAARDLTPIERAEFLRDYLAKRYRDRPLLVIPVDLPEHRAHGLLYITDQHIPGINTSGFLDVYQNRMCIRPRDPEILPEWAKFVRGLIDSRNLQPTAARDNVHRDAAYYALREVLGTLVTRTLVDTAREQPEFFRHLCEWHHFHFKGMALTNDEFFQHVARHLPFTTTVGQLSLTEYRARARTPEGEATPLFFFGHEGDADRFDEVCRARGIVAVNAGRVFDEELLGKIAAQAPAEFTLRCLDRLDTRALYAPLSAEEEEAHAPLIAAMQAEVESSAGHAVHVEIRRFDPPGIPAMLLETRDNSSAEGLRQLLNHPSVRGGMQELALELTSSIAARPRELLLNAANPLVQALAVEPDKNEETGRLCLRTLYVSALAHSRERLAPESGAAIREQLQRGVVALLRQRKELRAAAVELEAIRLQKVGKLPPAAQAERGAESGTDPIAGEHTEKP